MSTITVGYFESALQRAVMMASEISTGSKRYFLILLSKIATMNLDKNINSSMMFIFFLCNIAVADKIRYKIRRKF